MNRPGIGLLAEKQQRYGQIVAHLSDLGSAYSNTVLDATMGYGKLLTDEQALASMPESALTAARSQAQACKQGRLACDAKHPHPSAVLTYCDNAGLREELYRAYNTRASE